MSEHVGRVPLAAAIETLRGELQEAMTAGVGKQLKLRVDAVELSLDVTVTDAGKVSGGIKWWLLETSGDASRQSVSTQKLTVKFTPIDLATNGGSVNLGARE